MLFLITSNLYLKLLLTLFMNKHEKENIYYIDSLEAYYLALQFYRPNKDLLITDNTFIPNSSNSAD